MLTKMFRFTALFFLFVVIFGVVAFAGSSEESMQDGQAQLLQPVEVDKKWGFKDKEGKIVIQPQFEEVENFEEGLAKIKLNDKWGIINKKGKVVIDPKFDLIEKFKYGFAKVNIGIFCGSRFGDCNGGKWGLITKDGVIIVEPKFEMIEDIEDGIARVNFGGDCGQYRECKGGKWGIINMSGKLIVRPKFDYLGNFKNGLASAEYKKKWGFIDKNGNFVIQPKSNVTRIYEDALAEAKPDGTWVYTNKAGQIIKGFRENYYRGIIGSKYKIFVNLKMMANKFTGFYFYETIGTPINLRGNIGMDRSFMISEFDEHKKPTGQFKGKFSPSFETSNGEWWSADRRRNLPFVLTRFSEEREFDAEKYFGSYDIHVTYPRFYLEHREIQNRLNEIIEETFKKESLESYLISVGKEGDEIVRWYDIEYASDTVISMLFTSVIHYQVDEGKYDYNTYTTLNIGLAPNAATVLGLPNLFKADSNYMKVISDYCIAELTKRKAYKVVENGIKDITGSLAAFTITPQGLKFYFNPEKFGTGGLDVVIIPYNLLRDMMDTRWSFAR
jgi:hypothetical protein